MNLIEAIGRESTFGIRLLRLFARINDVGPTSSNLVCDDFEKIADKFPHNKAVLFEGKSLSYLELDQMANRYAHWGRSQKLKVGDTVAVLLPNRLEYLAIWIGLNKIGVISALINNSLTGPSLVHCLNISGAGTTIIDSSTLDVFNEVSRLLLRKHNVWVLDLDEQSETSHFRSLNRPLRGASPVRPERHIRSDLTASNTAMYIYTSGTTGLPKAAKISNARAQLYMKAFAAVSQMTPKDRIYITLPLYHSTGGLCGVGAALLNGASIYLKRKFSASQFWSDIVAQNCTHLVYIGELCRYLINAPRSANAEHETKHKLRLAFGNGLRPEVWGEFKRRFNIASIIEFYGSTEGNVSLFNLDGHPGAIGRVPGYLKSKFNIRLVQFDIDTEMPTRRLNGLCQEAKIDEVGEAIGAIALDARHEYSGYADKAASEKKILRNVFKDGDAWFRTGDLMRQDKDGYFYFVDRIGDTYRFKGENVSTSQVSERVASADHVNEAIIYGVDIINHDGKVGMAALIVDDEFDIKKFTQHVLDNLPNLERPRFVRLLQNEIETTGTFKYKKQDLVRQGFDITHLNDPIFVLIADDYIPFSKELMDEIAMGRLRF